MGSLHTMTPLPVAPVTTHLYGFRPCRAATHVARFIVRFTSYSVSCQQVHHSYAAGLKPSALKHSPCCHNRALDTDARVPELKKKVESFAGGFQMPGFDVKSIDHKVGQANGFANGHSPDIETDGQDHSNPVLNPVPC